MLLSLGIFLVIRCLLLVVRVFVIRSVLRTTNNEQLTTKFKAKVRLLAEKL